MAWFHTIHRGMDLLSNLSSLYPYSVSEQADRVSKSCWSDVARHVKMTHCNSMQRRGWLAHLSIRSRCRQPRRSMFGSSGTRAHTISAV